jgi:zinc-ribbon domain
MKYCTECGVELANEDQKFCSECGKPLSSEFVSGARRTEPVIAERGTSDTASTHLSLLEQELLFKQRKRRFAIALLLNALWAGSGNFYAHADDGGMMCTLTFIAWLISFATPYGFTLVFAMFIWSSTHCYRQIELDNQALRIKIAKGQIS